MDDYETDSSDDETQALEEKKFIQSFTKGAIYKYLYYNKHKSLDDSAYDVNSVNIIDDHVYENGRTNDVKYTIKIDLIETSNIQCIKQYDKDDVYNILCMNATKLLNMVDVTYKDIAKSVGLEEPPKLLFEYQTLTYYNHFNDKYRIGLVIDKQPITDQV
jgi:hypothetical protein